MWHPRRTQWAIIWSVALLLILAWPPAAGHSLGVKALHWLVDPTGTLPAFPPPLPMGLADDGDAVAAHDELESEYYQRRSESATTRWRMALKESGDPFDAQTERQLLVGLAVLSALCIWRIDKRSTGHLPGRTDDQ